MPSSFFELSVASTGLFTTKGAINVVAHNIANAETTGYSRQVSLIRARTPLNYMNGRGMIGTGSEMYGIGQVRNFYLDTKYWSTQGVLGEYSSKSAQNKLLQATLNETDETGFNAMIDNVFGSINRVIEDSSSMEARLSTINSSQALAQYFNTTYAALQKQQSDINQEVRAMVSTINNLGTQIQNLNKQIYVSELSGQQANDLRDARALIVDELSKFVNVEVKEVELNKDLLTGESDKHFQVMINGYDFIDHYNLNTLSCVERTVKNNFEDVDGLYDIYWKNGVKFNSEFSMASMSGELKGLLVTRDGNNQNCPASTITNVTDIGNGRWQVEFDVDETNRYDWPWSGTISIPNPGGASYAYDGYTYDEVTGKLTIEIPPDEGRMTVGSTVVVYSDLKVSGSTVEFTLDKAMTKYELLEKIKIGDMVLSGNITVTGNVVRIENCKAAQNISGLKDAFDDSVAAGTVLNTKVGQKVDYKGLPYFMQKLNTFVRGIARAFNLGEDVHGNKLDGITGHYDSRNLIEGDNTGYNFFAFTGSDCPDSRDRNLSYHLMTAGNFTVAPELLDNPSALAAALSENPDISDNNAMHELLSLKHNPHLYDEGEFGNFIQSIIGELGVITNQALTFESNYTDISTSIEYQRLSVSSVSMDEEMANLVYLQQIYNACAKLVSTLNGIYDTTINKLGL